MVFIYYRKGETKEQEKGEREEEEQRHPDITMDIWTFTAKSGQDTRGRRQGEGRTKNKNLIYKKGKKVDNNYVTGKKSSNGTAGSETRPLIERVENGRGNTLLL